MARSTAARITAKIAPCSKGIAIVAAGVAATAVFTASAPATNSGGTTLQLTAKATATVFYYAVSYLCDLCTRRDPHRGCGQPLLNGQGTQVGHFALVATQVTPRGELLLDVTLVLGQGQITAHGIEEPPANGGIIAITGGTGRYQSVGGEIRFRDTSRFTTMLRVVIER